ncbi:MAG: septum formation family protein [Actinomycetota bacterium]|nr:septum formation family protein [Actinomycetota bacterium]
MVSGQSSPRAALDGASAEVFEQVQAPQLGRCLDTVRGGNGPLSPPVTVACTEPHGGEIARVVEIPAAFDDDYPTDDDLTSDAWGSLLYDDDSCGDYLLPNSYLGAREQDNLLVDASAYLPQRVAWEAGARWLVCVVEYRTGVFEDVNAPGRMAQAMRGPDAATYRPCWFGPAILFDVVPCSQPHEAEPTGDYVAVELGTPYPADPLSRQPLVDECSKEVVDYLERDIPNGYAAGIYLPAEQDWAAYPEVQCVILDSNGRRTSGSAVDA